jgi:hypothetical protein
MWLIININMKKQYYFLVISALAAIVIMPAVILAQIDETASSSRPSIRNIPAKIRQEIRTDIQERQGNANINQNLRNNLLETRASTTRMYRNASSIMMSNIFEMRKNNIVNELQKALDNLSNVRARIATRIDKVTSSTASTTRDMNEARRLLVIADTKILDAQNAVNIIKNLSATSTISATPSATASTTPMDLKQPRLMATGAQNAIKDAKKALNDVVVVIAHAMGLKLENGNATATSTSAN